MTCHCRSPQEHADRRIADVEGTARAEVAALQARIKQLETELSAGQIKAADALVLDFASAGPYLVLKVQYPSCTACAYEGIKVLVFKGHALERAAIRWREIDPHFRPPDPNAPLHHAPPPIARFPGTDEGWNMALGLIDPLHPVKR